MCDMHRCAGAYTLGWDCAEKEGMQMKKKPIVSVIIPCKDVNDYVKQCLDQCLKLDYKNFSIILLPDSKTKQKFPKTRIFPTVTLSKRIN